MALDGTTGDVRSHWAPTGLLASFDLTTMVVSLDPAGAAAGTTITGTALAVLDASTGPVRFIATGGWSGQPLQLTDAAVISSDAVPPDPAWATSPAPAPRSATGPGRSYRRPPAVDPPCRAGCRSLPDDA